jgi:tetratricopeptide (TPR) repeat protein
MIILTILFLHQLCLLLLAGGRLSGRFHFGPSLFVVAILIPVFGPLCLVSVEINRNTERNQDKIIDVNQMKIEDEVYRSIRVEPDDDSKNIVPLEESLLLDPASSRRELLLKVLSLNVADYVPGLRMAGRNDDTEVVHYAVTALVELRKDFTESIEEMERRMENEEDLESLSDYIALEEKYLQSRLPENGELQENILRYDALLVKAGRDAHAAVDRAGLLMKRAENAMALEDYLAALEFGERLVRIEPEEERGYLLKIRCLSALKNRKEIDAVIQTIEDNHVFLSEEGRKALSFWQPNGVKS